MIFFIKRSLQKYTPLFTLFGQKKTNILLLRKARLFVKSRYSRNRQWSKSIVYFGLWFNIISVIWTTYYCYRYIFVFSHLYWVGFAAVLVAALRVATFINGSKLYTYCCNYTFKF